MFEWELDIDDFEKELRCEYRDETYTVRDNGAIFRHRKKTLRPRPLDEKWTYGKKNEKRGYMFFAGIMAHRIVATAFHGSQPSDSHVVDHKDTNRCNNRPKNLRWVTRVENILLNPITRRRIELAYGSIDNFFKNPSKPEYESLDTNFDWMRRVTKEEADASLKRLTDWANSGDIPSKMTLGFTIPSVNPPASNEIGDGIFESLTAAAVQKNWKTPTEFPNCPTDTSSQGIVEYHQNLKKGKSFSINEYGVSNVVDSKLSQNNLELVVMCNHPDGIKEWSVARISIGDDHFIHDNLGMFFEEKGALKEFTLARGLEWEGGETFDDLVS
ncbi:MAG: HNH endonuclease signature motif containing protein [Cyclobacteriaceae bacterium]